MMGKTSDLAVSGGKPVRTTPFPPRRLFGPEEKAAAVEVLDAAIASGNAFGYDGPAEQAYQKEFADWLGGGLAKTVNSGTSAILACLAALQLDCGSEVITPPLSDHGGVMPVPMLNCVPVPADTDGGSFNAGPEQIAAVITPRTRAIIVAHMMGEPADIPAIMLLAGRHGLTVIEDCAQTHGATIRGRMVGSWGTMAAFSTMSGKHHASGAQGGMIFTHDEELFWKARRFMDRGKPFNTDSPTNVVMGLNLNSNELASAIGRVQLGKLPGALQRRRAIAAAIEQGLRGHRAISLARLIEGAVGSYWFLRVRVEASALTVSKDEFAAAVAAEGIPTWASYRHIPSEAAWFVNQRTYGRSGCPWRCPLYTGPAQPKYPLPNCERSIAGSFLIAMHENWSEPEVSDTLAALCKVEAAYLRP
jgi:dTDP-4-amino-4,6-dideoxygalactose transaminase